MRIEGGYDIAFSFKATTPLLLQVHLHPELRGRLEAPESFRLMPAVPYRTYTDDFGNRCTRLVAPVGTLTLSNRFVIRDSGVQESMPWGARQAEVDDLPDDVLLYLLGSRYCDTDMLATLAWKKFRDVPAGYARVQAILDYVHDRIKFSYGHARADRTASEGHAERVGVCRDYAHLAITLCRCMNIPARYCTGYLGDIGVPLDPAPMDFSAWFEVFLDGRWHTMDARHNQPRIGRLLMARGRYATDAAISTAFGNAELKRFDIITRELTP
ncbi:MAG TPA: transglutaminase family protein [Rhizomicrobium sp.]|nr:transglutaminase family protein [Rhizomicrobium sp.]